MAVSSPNAIDVVWGFQEGALSAAVCRGWSLAFAGGVSIEYAVPTGGTIEFQGAPSTASMTSMVALDASNQSALVTFAFAPGAYVTDNTGPAPVYYVFGGGGTLPAGASPTSIVKVAVPFSVSVNGAVSMQVETNPPASIVTNLDAALGNNSSVEADVQVQAIGPTLAGAAPTVVAAANLPAATAANVAQAFQRWITANPSLSFMPLAYFASSSKPLAVDTTAKVAVPAQLGWEILAQGQTAGTGTPATVPASLIVGGMALPVPWGHALPSPLSSVVADAGALFSITMPAKIPAPWPAPPAGIFTISPFAFSQLTLFALDSSTIVGAAYDVLELYNDSGTTWSVNQTQRTSGFTYSNPWSDDGYLFNYQPGAYATSQKGVWSDATFSDTVSTQLQWVEDGANSTVQLAFAFSHVIEATCTKDDFIVTGKPATASYAATFGLTTTSVNSAPQVGFTVLSTSQGYSFSPDLTSGNTDANNTVSGLTSALSSSFSKVSSSALKATIPCVPVLGDLACTIANPCVDGNYAFNAKLTIVSAS